MSELAIATPPDKMGNKSRNTYGGKGRGGTTIYKMGGAQAIAALAYGTESVKKGDKIEGREIYMFRRRSAAYLARSI